MGNTPTARTRTYSSSHSRRPPGARRRTADTRPRAGLAPSVSGAVLSASSGSGARQPGPSRSRAEPQPGRLAPTRCLCSLPRGSRTGRESLTLGHRGGETRCYPRELRTTVPTFVGDSPFRCDCQHRPSRAVEKVTSSLPSSNPPSNPKDRGHRGADPPGRLLWEAMPCR